MSVLLRQNAVGTDCSRVSHSLPAAARIACLPAKGGKPCCKLVVSPSQLRMAEDLALQLAALERERERERRERTARNPRSKCTPQQRYSSSVEQLGRRVRISHSVPSLTAAEVFPKLPATTLCPRHVPWNITHIKCVRMAVAVECASAVWCSNSNSLTEK